MSKHTAESIKAHTTVAYWKFRSCGICHSPLTFTFDGDDVQFHPGCSCSYPLRGYTMVTHWRPLPSPPAPAPSKAEPDDALEAK